MRVKCGLVLAIFTLDSFLDNSSDVVLSAAGYLSSTALIQNPVFEISLLNSLARIKSRTVARSKPRLIVFELTREMCLAKDGQEVKIRQGSMTYLMNHFRAPRMVFACEKVDGSV